MSALSERDVERLTEALRAAVVIPGVMLTNSEARASAHRLADWLAERDAAIRAEAKAEAWDEGERAGRGGGPGHGIIPNPYRAPLGGDQ